MVGILTVHMERKLLQKVSNLSIKIYILPTMDYEDEDSKLPFFFKDFIYLFERDRERTSKGEGQRERDEQTPC